MALKKDKDLSPKEILEASLRPGNRVDVVLEKDEIRENLVVASSRLHDVKPDGTLILAQTSPPLRPSNVGRLIEITFLTKVRKKTKNRWIRTGYFTPLLEVKTNHPVGNGRETVLVVQAPKEVEEVNLRMHFRMVPPSGVYMLIIPKDLRQIVDQDLVRFLETARADLLADEVSPQEMLKNWNGLIKEIVIKAARTKRSPRAYVLDISYGGGRLSHPEGWDYPEGTLVQLTIDQEDLKLDLNAEVVRTGPISVARSRYNHFTGFRFVKNKPEDLQLLHKWIREIIRRELARKSGLEG